MPYGLWPMATAASAGSRRLRAGIPVRFAHSNVVGTYGSPTNAPLPDRLHLGFREMPRSCPRQARFWQQRSGERLGGVAEKIIFSF